VTSPAIDDLFLWTVLAPRRAAGYRAAI